MQPGPPASIQDVLRHLPGGVGANPGGLTDWQAPGISIKSNWILLEIIRRFSWRRNRAVSTATVLAVFARMGINESAARATIHRLVRQGLLDRHPRGRRIYLAPSTDANHVLEYAEAKACASFDPDFDGYWTLLAVSIPEERRTARDALRVRLRFCGYGLLGSGMWLSPVKGDIADVVADLGIGQYIKRFEARIPDEDQVPLLLQEAFDLDAIAGCHRRFLNRWAASGPTASDPVSSWLSMSAEWTFIGGLDPRLPLRYLPADWPALPAAALAGRLEKTMGQAAKHAIESELDAIPL